VGELIGQACGKASSASDGSSSEFKVTNFFPLNPNVILDHFFSIAYNSVISTSNKSKDPEPSTSSVTDGIGAYTPGKHLLEITPVSKILTAFNKRLKQSATILISEEHINRRKAADEKRPEREMYQEQRYHRRMLIEERYPRKVQNKKTIVTTVTFVVNVGKSISRQRQNVTGFNVENSENGCMNPVPCMSCFVPPVEGTVKVKISLLQAVEAPRVARG
jgi:hypothetical protein